MDLSHLYQVVDRFRETIVKFIKWICKKFDVTTEDNLIRDFEKETRTYLDKKEYSFNGFVVSACEYALKHMK